MSIESTLAGGRLSVMRVMPCAVSIRMLLKLGALTGANTSWSCGSSSYSSAIRRPLPGADFSMAVALASGPVPVA